MIQPHDIVAFDVETKGVADLYGLQPHRAAVSEAWLTTCAMAHWTGKHIGVRGYKRPDLTTIVKFLVASAQANQYVVGWNTAFDVAWILAIAKANGPVVYRRVRKLVYSVKWLDGLLLQRHIVNAPRFRPNGNMSTGLKPAVERQWPERAGYADDIDYDDESPAAVKKLLRYNKRDSAYTLALTYRYVEAMNPRQWRNALIEARCIPDVAESYVEGIVLNPEACKRMGEATETQRRLAYTTLKLNNPEVSEEILNSSKQLADMMFKRWGLPVVKLTEITDAGGGGNPSTDKESLAELAVHDERAMQVLEYRDATYCKAKFSTSPLASLAYNGDGRSRPTFRPFGTYTGRGTYSSKVGRGAAEQPLGVAIHQWKRDPLYREIIEPPEGYDLLEFDFAGQEYRWMAVESGDPQMLQLCMPGEDPHSFMGARIAGLDYRWLQANASTPEGKPKRQLGKVGNLSLQYRTYPATLMRVAAVQHKVKLTMVESKAIWSTYQTSYRKVPLYWKRQIQRAKAFGFVETLAGRRVELGFPDTWTYVDGKDASWSHESTAINFPIQGVGGDQKYLAILVAHDICTRYGARFYFELHDGIFFICPQDKSEAFGHEMKAALSNLPYERAWGVKLPIQFPVDGKRGPSWGKLKEFH